MVFAAPSGMQMRAMYLPVTVSSSDMNPRVISSVNTELEKKTRQIRLRLRTTAVTELKFRSRKEMQLNLLPDLTFSRASNSAFFRFLLSNWGRRAEQQHPGKQVRKRTSVEYFKGSRQSRARRFKNGKQTKLKDRKMSLEYLERRIGGGRGRFEPANLTEVVEEALEEYGRRDDDSADGGHGPRRRLVQRPRAVAAHFPPGARRSGVNWPAAVRLNPRREGVESALNGDGVEQMRQLLAACRCRRVRVPGSLRRQTQVEVRVHFKVEQLSQLGSNGKELRQKKNRVLRRVIFLAIFILLQTGP
jgi:hypothetical protein